MQKKKILLIEDEIDIRTLMKLQIQNEFYEVIEVENAEKAKQLVDAGLTPDLFLVDWMLPGQMNGLDFTKYLRTQIKFESTPIIMVTALSNPENVVKGLENGADDFINKPFDLKVLMARIAVQLRGTTPPIMTADHIIQIGDLQIDTAKCRVLLQNEEVQLTSTEYKILTILSQKRGHVFTRDQLISQIQGEQVHVTGRTIDTHIAGLRKKLNHCSFMIETIRGIGYRFTDEES